jgi:hypothetical protein
MEKYVDKMKSALNDTIEEVLCKRESIKLVSGYVVIVSKIVDVTITDFSELKLLDFVGGRKFEVNGEGIFGVVEKMSDANVKYVAFRTKKSIVKFNDLKQVFEVISIGEFSILDFTSYRNG